MGTITADDKDRMAEDAHANQQADEAYETYGKAVEDLIIYGEALEQESAAKKAKAYASPKLKVWLAQHDTLYDGETGWEGKLAPHGTPRHLDEQCPSVLVEFAFRAGLLSLNLGKFDKMPDSSALKRLNEFVNPPGEGKAILKVEKRDDEA